MAILPARRLAAITPSPTLAIGARAKELTARGHAILDLSVGEPDFTTPAHICAAAVAALERGDTHYTPVDGTPALKHAIAAKFARENGLEYSTGELIATCGAKQAMFNLCLALLNPGDEVLIPAPYWVSYPAMVRLAEAEPVIVPCAADTGFKLTAAALADALTPKTRLVILNSPSNPSGTAYTRPELEDLVGVLTKHPDVFIATDDIYEHLLYRDEAFVNLLMAAPALRERCVVINGVSKSYAMTGWRLGYAAGPAWLIGAMKKLQSQSTSNPAGVSQAAAAAALEGPQDCVDAMCAAFRNRRDRFVAGLNELPGIRCTFPDGAFYAFADCREAITAHGLADDLAFAGWLLEKAEIAVVPGGAFGTSGYVRFSYAANQATLDEALARMARSLVSD